MLTYISLSGEQYYSSVSKVLAGGAKVVQRGVDSGAYRETQKVGARLSEGANIEKNIPFIPLCTPIDRP